MNAKRFCQLLGLMSLVLFATGATGHAAKPSNARAISPADRAKMLDQLVEQLHGGWGAVRQISATGAVAADTRIPQDQKALLATELIKNMTREDILRPATIHWGKALSDSELRSIDAFLSSPVGKKMVVTMTETRPLVAKAAQTAVTLRYEKATKLPPPAGVSPATAR